MCAPGDMAGGAFSTLYLEVVLPDSTEPLQFCKVLVSDTSILIPIDKFFIPYSPFAFETPINPQ